MSAPHSDGSLLLSQGMACLREGRFAEAKPLLEEALRLGLDADAPPDERGISYERPQTANCHLQLAAALVLLGHDGQQFLPRLRGRLALFIPHSNAAARSRQQTCDLSSRSA